MLEVRQGLADTSLSDAARAQAAQWADDQALCQQLHAHASVLGRCGGSLRGRLCRWLAPLVKPVIEQIDLFHAALVRLLEARGAEAEVQEKTRTKVAELEQRLHALEEQAKRNP